MLSSLARTQGPAEAGHYVRTQLVNARPMLLALRCSIRSVYKWFAASRLRTD